MAVVETSSFLQLQQLFCKYEDDESLGGCGNQGASDMVSYLRWILHSGPIYSSWTWPHSVPHFDAGTELSDQLQIIIIIIVIIIIINQINALMTDAGNSVLYVLVILNTSTSINYFRVNMQIDLRFRRIQQCHFKYY